MGGTFDVVVIGTGESAAGIAFDERGVRVNDNALAIRSDVRATALRETLFIYPTQASNMAWML